MQENEQTGVLVSINTHSRSGTPSLLNSKKPAMEFLHKDQENAQIFSNENDDTFNQAPEVTKSKAGWKAMNMQSSSEYEDILILGSEERIQMKNLSSEDTFQTHLEMSKSCFTINYDDSYSGPPSLSEEEKPLGLCEREVVIDLVSDDSSSFILQKTNKNLSFETSKTDVISLLNSQETEEQNTSSPALASIESINFISPVHSERNEDDSQSEEEKQRLQREKEERETQELIWQLMRQEQMELYEMQVQYMQTQVEGISEEDLRALQAAMQENNHVVQTISSYASSNTQSTEENEEEEQEEEDQEEGEEEEEEWDYERLLALGQALGDVKTERWRARSKQVIDALPSLCYQEIKLRGQAHSCQVEDKIVKKLRMSDSHASSPTLSSPLKTSTLYEDYRCVVCMEDFEGSDEVKILPCTHYFHIACTTGWLTDHNSCPTCKKKVVSTPEK